jgi:hypothetical protein
VSGHAESVAGTEGTSPWISAPSSWDDVRNALEHAQYLLYVHPAARGLIDECRSRLATSGVVGLSTWRWEIVCAKPDSLHGVRDYRRAVRRAARLLLLGDEHAHLVHELAGRDGYQLHANDSAEQLRAPAPPVASACAAILNGIDGWRSGKAANQEALSRHLRTREPFRILLHASQIV